MFFAFFRLSSELTKWGRYFFENDNRAFDIHDCYFADLHESGNGGAIYLRSVQGSIRVNTVEFHYVTAGSTGGCYYQELNSPSVTTDIAKVCVTECSTTQNGQYAYFQLQPNNQVSHDSVSIARISSTGYAVYVTNNVLKSNMTNWNVSTVSTGDGSAFPLFGKLFIKYLNEESLQMARGFEIKDQSYLLYCNFVKNKMTKVAAKFIDTYTPLTLEWCFFEDNTNAYLSCSSTLTLIDCYFDSFAVSVSSANLHLTRCATSTSVVPTNFLIYSLGSCAANPYTGTMVFITDPPQTPSPDPTMTPYPSQTPDPTRSLDPTKSATPDPTKSPIPDRTNSPVPERTKSPKTESPEISTSESTPKPQPPSASPTVVPPVVVPPSEDPLNQVEFENPDGSLSPLSWLLVGLLCAAIVGIIATVIVCLRRKPKIVIKKVEQMEESSTIYEYSTVEEEEEQPEEDVLEVFSIGQDYSPVKEKRREVFKGVYHHEQAEFELDDDSGEDEDLMNKIESMAPTTHNVLLI